MSANLIPEIIDLIMDSSWHGLRLGLTCRRLLARMTNGLVGKWARPVKIRYSCGGSRRFNSTATCHELPNGVFHGRAEVEDQLLHYSRGKILAGKVDIVGRLANIFYHGNMLMIDVGEPGRLPTFHNGDIMVDPNERIVEFDRESWDIPADPANRKMAPGAWFDHNFETMCQLAGEKFRKIVTETRAKVILDVDYPNINSWPDCSAYIDDDDDRRD